MVCLFFQTLHTYFGCTSYWCWQLKLVRNTDDVLQAASAEMLFASSRSRLCPTSFSTDNILEKYVYKRLCQQGVELCQYSCVGHYMIIHMHTRETNYITKADKKHLGRGRLGSSTLYFAAHESAQRVQSVSRWSEQSLLAVMNLLVRLMTGFVMIPNHQV